MLGQTHTVCWVSDACPQIILREVKTYNRHIYRMIRNCR